MSEQSRTEWLSAKVLGVFIVASAFQAAPAATWCVGTACSFQTIEAAIKGAAAGDVINVEPGVYNESVTIGKSLSLIGSGSGTIINAFGRSTGIFVNGMAKAPAAGIARVVISGFTVTNANFEGILVVNATQVTVSNNLVSGNNRSLNLSDPASLSCPGMPAYETSEGDDCGEGIHLMAVDHSIVAGNTVKNNAGGILISDETGSSHDNLLLGNSVVNNIYDCGITLASHPAYAAVGLTGPAGVYRNTIYGNQASNNGTQPPGEGAGVGIYAAGPGNLNYANVVANNTLTGNGLPGVVMHNHAAPSGAPAPNMNDNMIIANNISGNAADSGDAATPSTTGINIFSVGAVTGTIIAGNTVRNEQIDIAVNTPSADVETHLNDLKGQTGVDNLGTGTVNANFNYWGCPLGPGANTCAGIVGTVLAPTYSTAPF